MLEYRALELRMLWFVDLHTKMRSPRWGLPVFAGSLLLSSSVHVPFLQAQEQGKSSSSQGQMLNYRAMPSMAGDLQIISIDHGSNPAECRADSKIRST